MIYEYFEELGGRVLPVIDMDDNGPSPSEAECLEAQRLEAALKARDPRVQLLPDDAGNVRVVWVG